MNFELFDKLHLIYIFSMLIACILIPFTCKNIDSTKLKNTIAKLIAIFMIAFDLGDDIIQIYIGTFNKTTNFCVRFCVFTQFRTCKGFIDSILGWFQLQAQRKS